MVERLAIFIDGKHTICAAKALGFEVDFKRLLATFEKRGVLLRAFCYLQTREADLQDLRPLIDWLEYNGFVVRTKSLVVPGGSHGERKVERSLDVDLTVDALEMIKRASHVILFSGRSEFAPLVVALQRWGTRVSVVSTIRTRPPMLAEELRRRADAFIELQELMTVIGRGPG